VARDWSDLFITADPGTPDEQGEDSSEEPGRRKGIFRRLRESGVYCEIHPFQTVDQAKIEQFGHKAIVLSGGPASVIEGQAPAANPAIFAAN